VKVKCVSPHGGGHHGFLRNDMPAVEGDKRPLKLPPNEGGYVDCPVLSAGPIAVGSVLDAPDDFVPDGFHFEAVEPPAEAAPPPAEAAPPKPAIVIPAPAGEEK
jgi:hypothetical protein